MNSPDLTAAMVKMILSLSVVLVILWAAHRWLRRLLPAGRLNAKGTLIKILGSHQLGMKKSIALVKVPGSVLVIGIGTEQINLLKSIDDPDLIAGLDQTGEGKGVISFRDHLQRLTRGLTNPFEKTSSMDDRGGMP
jgi:flagellar biogenesis protein FliO